MHIYACLYLISMQRNVETQKVCAIVENLHDMNISKDDMIKDYVENGM